MARPRDVPGSGGTAATGLRRIGVPRDPDAAGPWPRGHGPAGHLADPVPDDATDTAAEETGAVVRRRPDPPGATTAVQTGTQYNVEWQRLDGGRTAGTHVLQALDPGTCALVMDTSPQTGGTHALAAHHTRDGGVLWTALDVRDGGRLLPGDATIFGDDTVVALFDRTGVPIRHLDNLTGSAAPAPPGRRPRPASGRRRNPDPQPGQQRHRH
ncbi:hypothetical protein [Streptomyces mirabilis]|uniref:Uncharacterized protein n=1 Tax=Streptomyces mirabilis TaxID=68239 RepID=A0ABU3V534_9ACTN|nr:hypothetical protein [Streptomyces mirabilis]MCX5355633.1 hypothetical protein [Streptomyces mirabilis]MDU9001279.1 hypothetical protein [Streptomyces mirabilis]